MNSEIAGLEEDLIGFRIQLETVQSSLQTDPNNPELLALKTEIEEGITAIESLLDELKPPAPPTTSTHVATRQPSPPAEQPKWSKENHPAFQPGYRKPGAPPPPDEPTPVALKVNDIVLAKWISGDKSFYPARITSITGSSADPVYYVTFKSYGTTEALRGADVRPMPNAESKKRKAEGAPLVSAPSFATSSVISAAADIDPALASAAKKEPSKATDGPTKPAKIAKKIKAKKELEAGKSKWQDFAAKGKIGKGPKKKESMFRTGDSVTARVGFTGSGQAMRKDPARSRHVYQPEEEDY